MCRGLNFLNWATGGEQLATIFSQKFAAKGHKGLKIRLLTFIRHKIYTLFNRESC
jgi:hypothetical protein